MMILPVQDLYVCIVLTPFIANIHIPILFKHVLSTIVALDPANCNPTFLHHQTFFWLDIV